MDLDPVSARLLGLGLLPIHLHTRVVSLPPASMVCGLLQYPDLGQAQPTVGSVGPSSLGPSRSPGTVTKPSTPDCRSQPCTASTLSALEAPPTCFIEPFTFPFGILFLVSFFSPGSTLLSLSFLLHFPFLLLSFLSRPCLFLCVCVSIQKSSVSSLELWRGSSSCQEEPSVAHKPQLTACYVYVYTFPVTAGQIFMAPAR